MRQIRFQIRKLQFSSLIGQLCIFSTLQTFSFLLQFLFFLDAPLCGRGSKLSPLKQWFYGVPFQTSAQMLRVKEYSVYRKFVIL